MTKEINSWEDAIEVGEKLWGAIAKNNSTLFNYHHDNGSKSQGRFDFKSTIMRRLEKKEKIVFPEMDNDCPFCEYAIKLTRNSPAEACSVCIFHEETSLGCCSEWRKIVHAQNAKTFKSACQAIYNRIINLKAEKEKK